MKSHLTLLNSMVSIPSTGAMLLSLLWLHLKKENQCVISCNSVQTVSLHIWDICAHISCEEWYKCPSSMRARSVILELHFPYSWRAKEKSLSGVKQGWFAQTTWDCILGNSYQPVLAWSFPTGLVGCIWPHERIICHLSWFTLTRWKACSTCFPHVFKGISRLKPTNKPLFLKDKGF